MNTSSQTSVLKQKEIEIISEAAAKAEKDGKLTKAQMGLIHERQWSKMLVPTSYGGVPTSLPEVLLLEETLASTDGSMGWLVTFAACGGWVVSGFMEAEAAKKILGDNKVFIAHSSDNTGTAEKTKTGYKVSGKWEYVAGAGDATAFIGNCIVKEKTGEEQTLSFLFFKNEIIVSSVWNAMGLSATASYSVEVDDVQVPAERVFKSTGTPIFNNPLYQLPYTQLMEASLAANVSGMALHFIELCQSAFGEKRNTNSLVQFNDDVVNETVDKYTRKFHDARTKLHYAIEMSWQSSINNQHLKPATLYKISAAASELAVKACECADALFPYCGMLAADKSSEINRVWRDLHTACQHPLLVFGGMQ